MRDVIEVNRNGVTYQMRTAGLTNRDSFTKWKKELADRLFLDEPDLVRRALAELADRHGFRPPPPRRRRKGLDLGEDDV